MVNDDPTEKIDLSFSNNISRRRFLEVSVGAVACVSLSPLLLGCGGGDHTQNQTGYPIFAEVFTTRQRTIIPNSVPSGGSIILPWEPSAFKENSYGIWHYGPGVDNGKDLRIMPDGYDASTATNAASLLSFFTISDTHIYDKESPSQALCLLMKHFVNGIPGITYTMLYTTQILDAAIQTVNALHQQKPFDCGLFLGDACNNAQYNEARWYIDVIDGKWIIPSSGANAGANTIDYQKPYKAAGLDKAIPWYQTKGSHDNFWFGSNLVSDSLQKNYIGEISSKWEICLILLIKPSTLWAQLMAARLTEI